MAFSADSLSFHLDCEFSTEKIDNDQARDHHLAREFQSPWWYCSKQVVVLTGLYGNVSEISSGSGIQWENDWATKRYAKYAVMMIRPN